jgi:Leucine-rich repeat (LRR) protein
MFAGNYAQAADDTLGKIAIEFHTTIYDTYGDTNSFSLVLGATSEGEGKYIDVDCGNGDTDEYKLVTAGYDTTNEESTGTYVTCNVSKDGIVKIYCDDPSWIDWFDATGCYIDRITFSDELTNLVYMSLNHNELTSLDLSKMKNLQMLYLSDNTYSSSPLVIGEKPNLYILEINNIGAISSDFDINQYPNLTTLDAWNAQGLTKLTPSGCPNLVKLSVDGTNISSIDVSQNPLLQVLNVSDTRITELDVTNNPELYQLYCTHESSINSEYKIKKLDLSKNPNLYYLFCTGNDLTELDVTNNTVLGSLTARKNLLTKIDVSKNTGLFCLNISDNYIGFANLPWPTTTTDEGDVDLYTEYDYAQRNFPLDKSYPVGKVLEFGDIMLREHTDTEAVLYGISESDSSTPITIPASCYEFDRETGRFTIKDLIPESVGADSVYVSFHNSKFSADDLRTTMFKIKSTADYGQPTKIASFTSGVYSGTVSFSVGVDGATAANPKKFYVDFGNGKQEFTATTSDASVVNVSATAAATGIFAIYTDDDVEISALDMHDIALYNCDLTNLRTLRTLSLENTGIYSVDLQWNRCLQKLNLSHNNLSTFTLVANNQGYGKNALTDVDLSYNKLTTFEWNENYTVERFDISHNKLTELNLTGNTTIKDINIAYNSFSEFSCSDCTALTDLNVEGNQLSAVSLPDDVVLNTLNVSNNKFTLATLPDVALVKDKYTYAPQAQLAIPTKAPGVNLAAQDVNNHTTYTWKKSTTNEAVSALYYMSSVKGQFRFNASAPYVGSLLYCEMTNTDYPDFAGDNVFRTSVVETADMPSNKVCEFTIDSIAEGDDSQLNYNVQLTLTSATDGNALYIDWTGDESLAQYEISTSRTTFYPDVTENAKVTVYSYDADDNVTVFSLRNAKLRDFKLGSDKSLSKLICLNLTNAGLSTLDYPKAENLSELILNGNKLTEFDFNRYPNLTYLDLANNNLTANADFSNLSKISSLFIGGNGFTSVSFGKNDVLHTLFAESNELTTADFSNLSNLQQLHVNGNKLTDLTVNNNAKLVVLYANDNNLSHIDVSALKNLGVLEISGNNFKFSTLPLESEVFAGKSIYTYEYSKQADINIQAVDGVVDLSSEANINGTATTYTWFLGEADYDDYGELVNELLYGPDDNTDNDPDYVPEYLIEGGITKFVSDFSKSEDPVGCIMTNDLFPNLTLATTLIRPTSATTGVESVVADGGNASVRVDGNTVYAYADNAQLATLYGVNGAVVAKAAVVDGVATFNGVAGGFYLVKVADKAFKIVVK